jgi:carboxymethylenebutenolidase
MKYILLFGLLFSAGIAAAQDWAKAKLDASPRHYEWVDVKSGARTVKTFVVYPERKDKAPVVLLIHEIFGASDWAMDVADQLAAHGYIAVLPDLLSGMGPNGGRTSDFTDQQKIMEAVSNLPTDQVMGDLNAAADYAIKLPSANGKLSCAGFCWGGGQSFTFATVRPDLTAAFVFYGIGPQDATDIAKINAPIYGFYGGMDNRVTSTVPDQIKLMKAGHKKYQAKIYDGAGHGFMRAGEQPDANPDNKKAHDEAWKKWLDVLKKQ